VALEVRIESEIVCFYAALKSPTPVQVGSLGHQWTQCAHQRGRTRQVENVRPGCPPGH